MPAGPIQISPEEILAATKASRNKGTGSFIVDILGAPVASRSKALSKAVGKYRSAMERADVAAGQAASKATGWKRIFSEKKTLPVKSVGGLDISVAKDVKRISAPLSKVQRFAIPIFAYEGIRRMFSPKKEAENMMTREEQEMMTKAATLIRKMSAEREVLVDMVAQAAHEKKAMEIASEMLNRGMISNEEISKKASEISREDDLRVMSKALELSGNGFELGQVEKRAEIEGVGGGEEIDPLTDYLLAHV